MVAKWFSDDPKSGYMDPRWLQDDPREGRVVPNKGPREPKTTLYDTNRTPNWANMSTASRHKMASRRAHKSQDEPSWSQNWPCRVLREQNGSKGVVKRKPKRKQKGVCAEAS